MREPESRASPIGNRLDVCVERVALSGRLRLQMLKATERPLSLFGAARSASTRYASTLSRFVYPSAAGLSPLS